MPWFSCTTIECEQLPVLAGTYCLLLSLGSKQEIRIGKLGCFVFETGDYAYFGSALGAGGLRARLRHHIKETMKPHWHIDYLKSSGRFSLGYYEETPHSLECVWTQRACSQAGARVLVVGFGSSDCVNGCPAHLVYFSEGFSEQKFDRIVK